MLQSPRMAPEEKDPAKGVFSGFLPWAIAGVIFVVILLVVIDGMRPAAVWHPPSSQDIEGSGSGLPFDAREYVPPSFQPQQGQSYLFFGGVVLTAGLSVPVEKPVMRSSVEKGRLVINAKLFRGIGLDPVEVAGNRFQSDSYGWDLNYNKD